MNVERYMVFLRGEVPGTSIHATTRQGAARIYVESRNLVRSGEAIPTDLFLEVEDEEGKIEVFDVIPRIEWTVTRRAE